MTAQTYTLATEDGIVLLREDFFTSVEEAAAAVAREPLTPSGSRRVVVTTEQAYALAAMRRDARSEAEEVLARIQSRRAALIIGSNDHSASRRVEVLREEAPHLLAAARNELRVVVTFETDSGSPELLGTYTRSEEDAVFYIRPGGRENYAAADCCEIVTVTL